MEYISSNLLGREVTVAHVTQALLLHALAERTTADVATVEWSNIQAVRR